MIVDLMRLLRAGNARAPGFGQHPLSFRFAESAAQKFRRVRGAKSAKEILVEINHRLVA
jgi:hypothetical protein